MRCNCSQMDREIHSGELRTTHSKVCPAREDELRSLFREVVREMQNCGGEMEFNTFNRIKYLIGEGSS